MGSSHSRQALQQAVIICDQVTYALEGLRGLPYVDSCVRALFHVNDKLKALRRCDEHCVRLGEQVVRAALLIRYLTTRNIYDGQVQYYEERLYRLQDSVVFAGDRLTQYEQAARWMIFCCTANHEALEGAIKGIHNAVLAFATLNIPSLDTEIEMLERIQEMLDEVRAALPSGNRVHPLPASEAIEATEWFELSPGHHAHRRKDARCCAKMNSTGRPCENPAINKFGFQHHGDFAFCGVHGPKPKGAAKPSRWATNGQYNGAY